MRLKRRACVSYQETFAARFVDLFHGDFFHALPVFQRASVALVTWPAGEAPFNDDIFSPERPIAIAACRTKNRNDRCSDGRGKMHRARITAHDQSGSLTKRDQLF